MQVRAAQSRERVKGGTPLYEKCDCQRSRMIRWSDVVGNIGGFMQQRVVKTGNRFVRACDASDAR